MLVFRKHEVSNLVTPRIDRSFVLSCTDTGRLVGTGCTGANAARLAIARAQRQLAEEAGIHLLIRNFQVINTVAPPAAPRHVVTSSRRRLRNRRQRCFFVVSIVAKVGASNLASSLNCNEFAATHSSSSHFDRNSFVGLAWRPPKEDICCGDAFWPRSNPKTSFTSHDNAFDSLTEIYSTGRANLPGATAERQLVDSFYNILPELLRFSSSSKMVELFTDKERSKHFRIKPTGKIVTPFIPNTTRRKIIQGGDFPKAVEEVDVWEGYTNSHLKNGVEADLADDYYDAADDDILFSQLGL